MTLKTSNMGARKGRCSIPTILKKNKGLNNPLPFDFYVLYFYIFSHLNLLALRGPDCKYRESADSCKISQFILFYLKDPLGELFSKMEIKSSIALCFFRKIQKFKLRRGGPRPPGKTMKNSATSLTPYATTR